MDFFKVNYNLLCIININTVIIFIYILDVPNFTIIFINLLNSKYNNDYIYNMYYITTPTVISSYKQLLLEILNEI